MTRLVIAAVILGLGVLSLPTPASASWLPVDYFQSNSGRTYCTMYQRIAHNRASNKIECGAQRKRNEMCVKSYTLRPTGHTRVRKNLCGNPPAEASKAPYDTWLYIYGGTPKLVGDKSLLRCIFRRASGVTCRNRSRHGFTVRVGAGRTF